MNHDPRGPDPFDRAEPSLRWSWLVAPAVAGIVVLVMVVLAAWLRPGQPGATPVAGSSVLATRASAAGATTTAISTSTPTAAVSTRVVTSTAAPTADPAPSGRLTPTGHPTARPPTCEPMGVVDEQGAGSQAPGGIWVTLAARTDGQWANQLCPGERIRVFWASYAEDSSGSSHIYRSQVGWLDRSHPTIRFLVVLPNACGMSWYAGHGSFAIPTTYAKGWFPPPSHLVVGYYPPATTTCPDRRTPPWPTSGCSQPLRWSRWPACSRRRRWPPHRGPGAGPPQDGPWAVPTCIVARSPTVPGAAACRYRSTTPTKPQARSRSASPSSPPRGARTARSSPWRADPATPRRVRPPTS